MKSRDRVTRILGLALMMVLCLQRVALAVPDRIVLDGEFDDWDGKPYLEDGYRDIDKPHETKQHWYDIRYWYFTTNDDEERLYFMVERYPDFGVDDGETSYEPGTSAGIQFVSMTITEPGTKEVTEPEVTPDPPPPEAPGNELANPEELPGVPSEQPDSGTPETPVSDTPAEPAAGAPAEPAAGAPAEPSTETPSEPSAAVEPGGEPVIQPDTGSTPGSDSQGGENRQLLMEPQSNDKGPKKDKKSVFYTIFIDTDNNGEFDDVADASVTAHYYPANGGLTYVTVYRGGRLVNAYFGLWGETDDEGGLRCEFSVSFRDLRIEPGQVLRLVLFGWDSNRQQINEWDDIEEFEELVEDGEADRVPDTGDLQWAPVSTLGKAGFAILIGVGILAASWANKRIVRRPKDQGVR